jgi:hypothetical protein
MQVSLLEILRDIPDHRRREGKRFDLSTVLLYAILAMVAGANSYRQMHEFIRAGCGANFTNGHEVGFERALDQAASTEVQISGAILPVARSLLTVN